MHPHSSTSLPEKALREFREIAASDWDGGVPLGELLVRINRVAVHLAPEGERNSRVKALLTERSFRHYQTLGCIDVPEKEGRRAFYRPRHFVQALLVRRLLWERVPADQIAVLLAGRSTEETKRLLSDGVAFVARRVAGGEGAGVPTGDAAPEIWRRIPVAPGIELHVREDVPKLRRKETDSVLARVAAALTRSL